MILLIKFELKRCNYHCNHMILIRGFLYLLDCISNNSLFGVVYIDLAVCDVKSHKSLLDNSLCSIHIVVGNILDLRLIAALGRSCGFKGGIYTALDIYTPADLVGTFDIGVFGVSIIAVHSEKCQISESQNAYQNDEKHRFFNFFHLFSS